MKTELLIVDDHLLLRILLNDEPTEMRPEGGRVFTTGLWYYRLCRSLGDRSVAGVFSRALGGADPAIASAAIESVTRLPDSIEITPHRADDRTMGTHDVVTAPGTLAARVAGARQTVRSHHHQGVARVGEGLTVSATAADGIVEAIEDPALRFCLGVLWHPDADPRGTGAAAFAALVTAATALSSTPA